MKLYVSYSSQILSILAFSCILSVAMPISGHARDSDNRYSGRSTSRQSIAFDSEDRAIIRDYYDDYYYQTCGRTFGKNSRNKNCQPPPVKKRYQIGRNLPQNIKLYALPSDLEEQLLRLPRNYQYARLDKDILILSTATGRVADAVEINNYAASSRLYPIEDSYAVYFDPRTATLSRGESRILDQVARQIKADRPRQVTITSYADGLAGRSFNDGQSDVLFQMLEAFGISTRNGSNESLASGLADVADEQERIVTGELSRRGVSSTIVDSRIRGPLEGSLMPESEMDRSQIVVIDLRN